MTERTYPREWFAVWHYYGQLSQIEATTFDRETPTRLYRGRGSTNKTSDWLAFYPTRAEAEAALAERIAAKGESDADKLVRDAAPELLPFVELLASLPIGDGLPDDIPVFGLDGVYIRRGHVKSARAAIAKARGQS